MMQMPMIFMIFMKFYDFILDALPEKEPHLPEALGIWQG